VQLQVHSQQLLQGWHTGASGGLVAKGHQAPSSQRWGWPRSESGRCRRSGWGEKPNKIILATDTNNQQPTTRRGGNTAGSTLRVDLGAMACRAGFPFFHAIDSTQPPLSHPPLVLPPLLFLGGWVPKSAKGKAPPKPILKPFRTPSCGWAGAGFWAAAPSSETAAVARGVGCGGTGAGG
jgi:hypothetical protein